MCVCGGGGAHVCLCVCVREREVGEDETSFARNNFAACYFISCF